MKHQSENSLDLRSRIRAPELRALFDYWDGKRGFEGLMLRSQLDPGEIVSLLPLVFILEVQEAPRRYLVRLMGTGIVAQLGEDHTGRYLDDMNAGDIQERELVCYDQVVDRTEPHLEFTEFAWRSRERMRMERLALPMSADGRSVNYVLGAALHTSLSGRRQFVDTH